MKPPALKFMLAAGAYWWRSYARHDCFMSFMSCSLLAYRNLIFSRRWLLSSFMCYYRTSFSCCWL